MERDKQLLLRELEELHKNSLWDYRILLEKQEYYAKHFLGAELTEATQEIRAKRLVVIFLEKSIKELICLKKL